MRVTLEVVGNTVWRIGVESGLECWQRVFNIFEELDRDVWVPPCLVGIHKTFVVGVLL